MNSARPIPASRIAKSGLAGLLVIFCVVLLGSLAFSQQTTTATILGTITDPSGSVIPNVTVTILHNETGQTQTIKTNDSGEYVVPALPIGHYTVKAEAPGFKVAQKNDLVLNVGDRFRADFGMQVGTTSDTVTVEAEAIKVQSDSGEVSDVITGQQVTQLESNGRSIYSLANLTPGASSLQMDAQVPTSMGGDSSISFNGQRAAHNIFMLDGGESDDRGGGGGSIVMPSEDAIAEFRELTSNYSAEYGASSAATISTVLKSGTKQFHASAWEFDRNDAFNARNYFNPAVNASGSKNKVSELRLNVFGFNVGGPVEFHRSDNPKTFFFYNMEWRRQVLGGGFNRAVPFPSTYGGNLNDAVNFNSGALLNSGQTLHVPNANQLSAAQLARFTADGLTPGGPFPNNTIPANLLDPNAQALLKAGIYPAPTTGDAFVGSAPAPTSVKEELVRIDHQFTDKFSVFGHWVSDQVSQTDIPTRWSGDNLPTVGDTFGNPSYSATIHTTYSIRPTLLNEASFNYDGNRISILPLGLTHLPGGYSSNRIFSADNTSIIPVIGLGGQTGANYDAQWVPWLNKADDYQFRDDVSWTKGSHQIKIGGSWAIYKKIQPLQVDTQGNFGFNGNFTGYDFADFLLGYANSYGENALKDSRHWNSQNWAAYVQDDWRATSRLTVNLGLRWDGLPHTYEANNQQSNFYPKLYNPAAAPIFSNASGTQISPASPGLGTSPNPALAGYQFYLNGIGIAGVTPGVTNALVSNHWAAFGPRLGFAYDLTGSGKTILRGGFGIMYERIQGNDMYQNASDAPFSDSVNLNTVSLSDPHVNVTTGVNLVAPPLPIVVQGVSALNSNNYALPQVFQYSAGVQRQLGGQSVLSMAYVGSQSRHQSYAQELNAPPQGDLPAILVAKTIPYNRDLPYLGYSSIKFYSDGGNSHYNSLQVELHSNIRHDLQLQAAYTLSKSVDPSTGTGGDGWDLDTVSNPYGGPAYDNGPSVFDRRHVAFVNFIYDLPIFRGSQNHLLKSTLGGWQLSGIVTMESGAPINLGVSGATVCNQGLQNCSVRPNVVGGNAFAGNTPAKLGSGNPTVQYLNPADFTPNLLAGSSIATFGNLTHDAFYGPGRDNWNLALFKSFVLSESRGSRLELRFESYNTWNHTQFLGNTQQGGLDTNVGDSHFGQFTGASDPRTLQLGAKLYF